MKVETAPISKLKLDERNARVHDERNLAAVRASLEEFGQQKPIVVGPGNVVVAGNGTLAAAIDLGWSKIEIVRTRLRGSKIKAYAIADNRSAELATWDEERLAEQLRDLAAEDDEFDPGVVGFIDQELQKILDGDTAAIGDVESGEAESFDVVVSCRSAAQQAKLLARLEREGYECRPAE